jgi:hypothetical protein
MHGATKEIRDNYYSEIREFINKKRQAMQIIE